MNNVDNAVLETEKASNQTQKNNTITLSSGVILRVKKVNSLLFADLMQRFERPKPPVVFIEDKGRSEENPSDPDYLDRISEWEAKISVGIADLMILLGTEIVAIPKGIEKPESNGDWLLNLEVAGYDVRSNPRRRYLLWVKYYAGGEDGDIRLILDAVGRLSGVSEADVSDAVEKFRR